MACVLIDAMCRRFLDLVKQKSKEKKEQSKGSKAYIDAYKKAIGGEEAITKKIIEESGKVWYVSRLSLPALTRSDYE